MIPALKRACMCARGYAYVGGSVCRLLARVCVCVYVNVVKQNCPVHQLDLISPHCYGLCPK